MTTCLPHSWVSRTAQGVEPDQDRIKRVSSGERTRGRRGLEPLKPLKILGAKNCVVEAAFAELGESVD